MQMNYHLTVVHHNEKIVVTVKDERKREIKYSQMLKVITRGQDRESPTCFLSINCEKVKQCERL